MSWRARAQALSSSSTVPISSRRDSGQSSGDASSRGWGRSFLGMTLSLARRRQLKQVRKGLLSRRNRQLHGLLDQQQEQGGFLSACQRFSVQLRLLLGVPFVLLPYRGQLFVLQEDGALLIAVLALKQ